MIVYKKCRIEVEKYNDDRGVRYMATAYDKEDCVIGYTHDSYDRSQVVKDAKSMIRDAS